MRINIDFDQSGNLLGILRGNYIPGERIEINEFNKGSYAARWFYGSVIQKTLLFKWKYGEDPTVERYSYTRSPEYSQHEIDIETIGKICNQILVHEVLKT